MYKRQVLTVHGVGVHPGSAKNVMVNAPTVAMAFHALLPEDEVPEKTEGYEGFFHLTDMEGGMAKATLRYIIRDHDREKFEEKKALFAACAEKINEVYGEMCIRDRSIPILPLFGIRVILPSVQCASCRCFA